MSDEERRESLADQAAAWIPPWERPTRPKQPPTDPSERTGSEILDSFRSPGTETVQDLDLDATVPAGGSPGSAESPGHGGVAAPSAAGPDATAENAAGPGAAAGPDAAAENAAGPDVASGPDAAVGRDVAAENATGPDAGTGMDGADLDATGVGGHGPRDGVEVDGAGSAGNLPAEGAAADVPGKRGRRRVTSAPEPAPELDDAELRGALEAILLVVDEPVSELTLAQVLQQRPERIGPVLDEIAAGYTAAGHGFELRRAAGGWRLYTRPEYATYVERFVLDGQSVRLTQAALETLAVIAYKQPVTRSRISAIRGVNGDGVIRTLVSRGLVEECGTEPDSGAFLYRTTTMFLEKLGLNSVSDLPPLAPFLPDDVEELADATR